MTAQDTKQVTATNNMFAETMRYFQYLPSKKVRNAEKLDKWSDEAISVFWGSHDEK